MYHIITNLELMFDGVEDAQEYAASNPLFEPRVPLTAMPEEDRTTPRICGAPTIKDCVSALKPMGIFRRCMNRNPDAKSYENDDEVYPVFVVTFSDNYVWKRPSKDQVPDVDATNEHWLTFAVHAESIELRWLDAYSLKSRENKDGVVVCTGVTFVDDLAGRHHPWLDGKGHPLDNSDMGGDPWPRQEHARQQLWFDFHFGGQLGYMVQNRPFDGRCRFYPLDTSIEPYNSFPDRMKRFSGLLDQDGRMALEDMLIKYRSLVGYLVLLDGLAWTFVPMGSDPNVPIDPADVGPDRRVNDMTVLNPEDISLPDVF